MPPELDVVSFTHDKTLARCEQKFHYRYEELLVPKLKKLPFFKGDWVHKLLQALHLGKDWKRLHRKLKKQMWDGLFDEEKENYGPLPEEVDRLVSHYSEYYKDKWQVIESERYRRLPTKLGIKVAFKVDLIVKRAKGIVAMMETKTKKKLPDAAERLLNVQAHSYAYLLEQAGIKVNQVIFNYIRTTPPTVPRILKDGSVSRKAIETDKKTYLSVIHDANEDPKDYQAILDGLPDTVLLQRKVNTPNLKVGKRFVQDWVLRRMSYLKARKTRPPLRTFTYQCTWDCEYYDLCITDLTGKDRNSLIQISFQKKEKELEL